MSAYYNFDDLKIVASRNPSGYFTRHSVLVWVGLSHGYSGYPEVQSLENHDGYLCRPLGKTAFRMVVAKEAINTGRSDAHVKEVRYNCYRPRDGGLPTDELAWVYPLDVFKYLRANGLLDKPEYEELEHFVKRIMSHEVSIAALRSLFNFWRKCKSYDHHYHQNDTDRYTHLKNEHVEMTSKAKLNPVCKEMMIHHKVPFYPGIIA